jgi:hypothetical protein
MDVGYDAFSEEFSVEHRSHLTSATCDDFEPLFQVPTDCEWTLAVNGGKPLPCSCLPGKPQGTTHVDLCVSYLTNKEPLRAPVLPADVVSLRLRAAWTDKKGKSHEQYVLDGTFVVPDAFDLGGTPGYAVNVPHLRTVAYLTVANVLVGDAARLELLGFALTLLM